MMDLRGRVAVVVEVRRFCKVYQRRMFGIFVCAVDKVGVSAVYGFRGECLV